LLALTNAKDLQKSSLGEHTAALALLSTLLSNSGATPSPSLSAQIATAKATEQATAKAAASADLTININITLVNTPPSAQQPPAGPTPQRQKIRGEHLPPPTWFFNSNQQYQLMARTYCAQKSPVVDSLCQQIEALNQNAPA
jgi:hypothetical protein